MGIDARPHRIEAGPISNRLAQAFGEPALHEIHQRIQQRQLGSEAFGRQPPAETGGDADFGERCARRALLRDDLHGRA